MPMPVAAPLPTGALRLADWGVLRAEGADARRFLQSQLTQDVESLAPGQARLAGYCSAKGRLIASFVVWAESADELLLAGSADLLAPTLARLQKFVLRARCKLSDAGDRWALWGSAGPVPGDATQAPWSLQVLPEARRIVLPPARIDGADLPLTLWAASAGGNGPDGPALAPQAWAAFEAASGVARITAATSEQFVPQMVNFEQVGGVNFHKGCYPGQEVVARSQYRGTLKRRAALFEGSEAAHPGQELFHDGDPGQPAGMVVLAGALAPGRQLLLAEVKLAALDSGVLHLGAPAGAALQRRELPYTLEPETA